MLTTGEYKGPDYYNYDGSINPDSSYAQKLRKDQFGQGDRRNSSNKIDTSNKKNEMSSILPDGSRTIGGPYGKGGKNAKSFVDEYSVALPPTMGGYRKKDMVDLELGREGRISPFVAVGQSKQSPNLGWVNDDARGVFGGEYRPYIPGGRGGINVSIRPNIQNTNTFNPQNTFSPQSQATANPTLQTAGGNIDESTAQGGGPYTAGRDITPVSTGSTATTGDSGAVLGDTPGTAVIESPGTTIINPGVPYTPNDPGVPYTPNDPGVPYTPGDPGVPSDPGVPYTPGDPGVPSDPGVPYTPGDPGVPSDPGDPGVPSDPGDPGVPSDPGVPAATAAAEAWVEQNVYGGLLNRASSEDGNADGLDYWVNQYLAGGGDQTAKDNILRDVKLGDEYTTREKAKNLASTMENKNYVSGGTTGAGAGIINEASLDAWVGPGGTLTQSSDQDAAGYYQGVGSIDDYVDPDTGGAADQSTSDLFDLYQTKFNRNPDEEGLAYWEEQYAGGTPLSSIADSFDASVEAELRSPTTPDTSAGTGGGNTTITQVNQGNNDIGVTTTGQNNTPPPPDVDVVTPAPGLPPASTQATTYGGGTEANNFITDQAAYDADQAAEAANITHSTTASNANANDYLSAYANLTTDNANDKAETIANTQAITDTTTKGAVAIQQKNAVDSWLDDFYAEHGINQGKVDQGGRDYWTEQLKGKDKATVERDILYAAANA